MNLVESFCAEVRLLKKGDAIVQGNLSEIKNQYEFQNLVLPLDLKIKEQLEEMDIAFTEELSQLIVKVRTDKLALAILNELIDLGFNISQFQILKPTLQEIFVERVG